MKTPQEQAIERATRMCTCAHLSRHHACYDLGCAVSGCLCEEFTLAPAESKTRFSVTLDALTSEALNLAMAKHLEAQGYSVSEPNARWETPTQFCGRVRISVKSLSTMMRHPGCPRIQTHRGPSGRRILLLLATSDFDAFCRRNKG